MSSVLYSIRNPPNQYKKEKRLQWSATKKSSRWRPRAQLGRERATTHHSGPHCPLSLESIKIFPLFCVEIKSTSSHFFRHTNRLIQLEKVQKKPIETNQRFTPKKIRNSFKSKVSREIYLYTQPNDLTSHFFQRYQLLDHFSAKC